jgi:PKD repeat protein
VKRQTTIVVGAAVCVALVVAYFTSAEIMKGVMGKPKGLQTMPAPIASFTASSTSGAAPFVAHFTDTSAGSPTAWLWKFGDGATSTSQNPAHSYRASGSYTVSLTVSNAHGSNSITKSGYITVSPIPPTPGWTTILDDEFNSPGVPSHWTLYRGSYGDSAHNCAAPSQVQVPGDGYLHLKMQYLTKGACGPGWYTGGMQVSAKYGGVDQAITVRWRIVPSADQGVVRSHFIIPMRWVDDSQYPWYRGESNYCEGSYLGGCYTYLHYGPNSRQIMHGYLVDLTKWHIWRVEVRNHKVSIFVDDLKKPVWVYQGDETTTPASFKRTVLQQECPLSGCPPATYAGNVQDIQIDWIMIQNPSAANADMQAARTMCCSSATTRADHEVGSVARASVAPIVGYSSSIALGVESRKRFIPTR